MNNGKTVWQSTFIYQKNHIAYTSDFVLGDAIWSPYFVAHAWPL